MAVSTQKLCTCMLQLRQHAYDIVVEQSIDSQCRRTMLRSLVAEQFLAISHLLDRPCSGCTDNAYKSGSPGARTTPCRVDSPDYWTITQRLSILGSWLRARSRSGIPELQLFTGGIRERLRAEAILARSKEWYEGLKLPASLAFAANHQGWVDVTGNPDYVEIMDYMGIDSCALSPFGQKHVKSFVVLGGGRIPICLLAVKPDVIQRSQIAGRANSSLKSKYATRLSNMFDTLAAMPLSNYRFLSPSLLESKKARQQPADSSDLAHTAAFPTGSQVLHDIVSNELLFLKGTRFGLIYRPEMQPLQLMIDGSWLAPNCPEMKLPQAMCISGHVDFWRSKVSDLPESFHIKGDLELGGTHIRRLPKEYFVGGRLLRSPPFDCLRARLGFRRKGSSWIAHAVLLLAILNGYQLRLVSALHWKCLVKLQFRKEVIWRWAKARLASYSFGTKTDFHPIAHESSIKVVQSANGTSRAIK